MLFDIKIIFKINRNNLKEKSKQNIIMPEQTETLTQKPEEVVVEDKGPDSGTESESDDSIPELEDTGAGGAGEGIGAKDPVAAAAGLNEELVSKGKKNHVQIGIETGCWCCPSHHQKIEKHSVCNCEARCLQEPSKRHLHCFW